MFISKFPVTIFIPPIFGLGLLKVKKIDTNFPSPLQPPNTMRAPRKEK